MLNQTKLRKALEKWFSATFGERHSFSLVFHVMLTHRTGGDILVMDTDLAKCLGLVRRA